MFIMAGQKKRTIYPVNFTTETNTVQLTLCLASYRRPGTERWVERRGQGGQEAFIHACEVLLAHVSLNASSVADQCPHEWCGAPQAFIRRSVLTWIPTGPKRACCTGFHTHSAGLLRRTSRTKALNHPRPTPLLILMSITVGLPGRNVPSSGTIPQFHHLLLDGRLPRTLVLLVSGPSHNRHNIEL